MNIQTIYELLDRFEQSSIGELSLNMEGVSLKLKKPEAGVLMPMNVAAGNVPGVQMAQPQPAQVPEAKSEAKALHAPLAGTFYTAASPDGEPFVKAGQAIKKGDVIGIIEAMKIMNEVTASEDGVVEEVVAENGVLVAYDEVLLRYV